MPHSDFWPYHKVKTGEHVNNGENAEVLQKQLGDMEGEVKEIQMELAAIRKDRLDLYNRKQSTGLVPEIEERMKLEHSNALPEGHFKKYPEIAMLQEELIRTKNAADEERHQREKYENKLKDLELKLNNICCVEMVADIKETKKYSEEEIAVLKSQVRDMKEETEELKLTLAEKSEQLQEYRVKYLQAQQQVEELKRQLNVVEYDSKQVSEQIQAEIQNMKLHFQEKLQDLAPLPDLLKGAQIQLQEARQLQRLAEDSSSQLSNELHRVKDKLVVAVNSMNQEKAEKNKLNDETNFLKAALEGKGKEIEEMSKTLEEYKCKAMRNEEKLSHQEMRFKEKASECAQILSDIEELRVENTRSLTRSKERADCMRKYLQTQISELERQLIQSRAQCRSCQKERDEIRQRMQIQINNLQENFELAEIRFRALQNQVSSLKNSYTVILADQEDIQDITDMNKIVST